MDRRCSVLSLNPHVEVVIACTGGFVKEVIVTELVYRRRCSVVPLYPHIEVNISCTRGFVKDVIVRGRCLVISLYPHINIVLPTILDSVLSTLNKIAPSDKSCRSVKFNS